ncbi:MAG: S-layer homology domain-containing protein [Kosmotogaceae bacterium]
MKKVMTLLIMLSLAAFLFGFTDLNEGHWAYSAVNELYEEGILEGIYEDDVFDGSKAVSRFELAVTLQNILDYVDDGDKTNAEKLVSLETRVKALESIEDSFEDLDVKTESNLRLLTALENKVEKNYNELSNKYSDLVRQFGTLENKISGFEKRVSALEEGIKKTDKNEERIVELESLYNTLVDRINDVNKKADEALSVARTASEKVNNLESQINQNSRSMRNLGSTINILIIANVVILIIALVGLFTP